VPTSLEQHNALRFIPSDKSLRADFVHDNIRPFEELPDSIRKKDYNQTEDVVSELNRINELYKLYYDKSIIL